MSDNTMPVGGNCEDKKALFDSPYMERFDVDTFDEEHPDATPSQVAEAKRDHAKNHALAVSAARQVCGACPVLQACSNWILNFDDEVYGVVAGMTKDERNRYKNNRSTAPVTALGAFAHRDGDEVSRISLQLMEAYTGK